MRGMIRTLALGAVLAAAAATGAIAQGVNNTGYDRSGPYYGNPQYGTWYGNQGYAGSSWYGDRNTGRYYGNDRGYVAGPVSPPYGDRYGYYGSAYNYGNSPQPDSGSGGGAAYDRGYNRPSNYGYWGR